MPGRYILQSEMRIAAQHTYNNQDESWPIRNSPTSTRPHFWLLWAKTWRRRRRYDDESCLNPTSICCERPERWSFSKLLPSWNLKMRMHARRGRRGEIDIHLLFQNTSLTFKTVIFLVSRRIWETILSEFRLVVGLRKKAWTMLERQFFLESGAENSGGWSFIDTRKKTSDADAPFRVY